MNKDKIESFTLLDGTREVSNYHLKLMQAINAKMNKAVVSSDGKYLITSRFDKVKRGGELVELERVEVWNLSPEKPSFLGMKIENLFDFFMIFVYMAGAAAIILFVIHKWLLKMMHGIR